MNPIKDSSIVQVNDNHIAGDLLDGEIVIMNKQDNIYYGLNDVGGRIWQLIKEPRPVSNLIDTLMEEYEVDRPTCTSEVMALLNDMAERGLITLQ